MWFICFYSVCSALPLDRPRNVINQAALWLCLKCTSMISEKFTIATDKKIFLTHAHFPSSSSSIVAIPRGARSTGPRRHIRMINVRYVCAAGFYISDSPPTQTTYRRHQAGPVHLSAYFCVPSASCGRPVMRWLVIISFPHPYSWRQMFYACHTTCAKSSTNSGRCIRCPSE